ncbi:MULTISPECIES: NAD(P)H-dependent oxidoreductase [Prauserella salsuginis group]|uniref:NAD(P)H-dependent oxidoreductase n=2 Tax=Prauserella salsuginis group TaxID=2893672 RepID=A0ABW6G5M2_9PSEU|nr:MULTISPECIES: SAF domain-containing protein [Prauserella salsuginis group]MBB3661214.1 putative homoserine dehydrogenase-like protein [Prauserella sediminis]MCR3719075.1 putative homoserine dehydrogenase, contains C-terminal SAF domain [Prauserella flava]MCR3733645.1 putative homoserine dehydrogenase, contains C-terminal SAF domain [Prauserella salsuginis]
MRYVDRLRARERELGRPVRVGLVGAGQMGLGFVVQASRIAGMEVAAIADIAPDRGRRAFAEAGCGDAVLSGDRAELSRMIEAGTPVVTEDATALTALPLDVLVDASGVPEVGAQVAFHGLLAGQDIAMLNVECDVTIGYLLKTVAERTGRVYTVCRGDEPVECKALADYVRDIGFDVVCAGKGKNNPLRPSATPASLTEEAEAKGMNPHMLASFVDGSKTMIEMAALANGVDLAVPSRGMTGPHSTVEALAETFRPEADGGVLPGEGMVDYCTGPVAPGVFVIGRSDHPAVVSEMAYLGMGKGPYYAFYRPYHLASVEAPLSVAEAVLDRTPSLAPVAWNAEVLAVAKRDLAAGEAIDGIGGETVYGITDRATAVRDDGHLPLGLVAGGRVLRDVPEGTVLTAEDVAVDESTTIATLRRLQDRLLAGEEVTVR